MILSNGDPAQLDEFKLILENTDNILNETARKNEKYFLDKGGKKLEKEVFDALNLAAQNTSFKNTIKLVSGASFPDIVANKYYGVEVKSTEKNQWQSIGSSILESTRDEDVKRIFMTFGKLGIPSRFITKPYELCLSDIVVTHYPRYRIDMKLQENGLPTIFEKMGTSYDELRLMDNPVPIVSNYYKQHLRPGQSLWWASNDASETSAPMVVRLWTTLDPSEKEHLTTCGYVFFPETISQQDSTKYQRYALWLATDKGVVNANIRDSFSAGGKYEYKFNDGSEIRLPAICGRIFSRADEIRALISETDDEILASYWRIDHIKDNRVQQWIDLVLRYTPRKDVRDISHFLEDVFID